MSNVQTRTKLAAWLPTMLLMAGTQCWNTAFADRFEKIKSGFAVSFKQEVNDLNILGIYVMPGEVINFEVTEDPLNSEFELKTQLQPQAVSTTSWNITMPDKHGLYPLKIVRKVDNKEMLLNVFVMIPLSAVKNGKLNKYTIGQYPDILLRDQAIYKPPLGLIEVTKKNLDTRVSPHYQVKEFLSKQKSNFPKYLVLQERLFLKLELLIEKINHQGIKFTKFTIMSGYRTPFYNKAIHNVKYSRHQWGGAADIYIDEDKNGVMDDINGDGKVDIEDAATLYEIIDGFVGNSFYEVFIGGLGQYKATSAHGPFVHVDVRGSRARWGR